MLSSINSTNLETLELSNQTSSKESLPKRFCKLIGSSASSLTKISVTEYGGQVKKDSKLEEQVGVKFSKLAHLDIKGLSSPLGQYLLNNSYPKLQHLTFFLSKMSIAHPQVRNLIRSHSESLKSIALHGASGQEESSLKPKHDKQILFPKLKSLSFDSRFSSDSVEALFFVEGSNLDSLAEEEQFISLETRLLEIAPKLQTYHRWGAKNEF